MSLFIEQGEENQASTIKNEALNTIETRIKKLIPLTVSFYYN